MEQGRTAVCPDTTVTFTMGTSNVGSIASAEKKEKGLLDQKIVDTRPLIR